jgi:hypothetical protein
MHTCSIVVISGVLTATSVVVLQSVGHFPHINCSIAICGGL